MNEAGEGDAGGGTAEAAPASSSAPEAASTDAAAPTEAPAYTPNYTFKVMDQEMQFDPFLHGVIKDQETEKRIREIYEKAHGLDYVKPKYESLKNDYTGLNKKWGEVEGSLKQLGTYLENKDLGSFLGSFNLTDEDIFKYALERLEYFNLPPEKRQAMDAQMSRNQQFAQMQLENERLKQQQEQAVIGGMAQQLNATLNAPHVTTIAANFDAQAGQQGAFRNAVIAHAQTQSHLAGRDLGVQEAVESFIKTFGLAAMASQPSVVPTAGVETSQAGQRPQTLPKVNGGQSTPVKKQVKSLNDLRKLQETAFSSGHGHRE